MKRIIILGAYQPDDLKTIIKTVKDNIDLTKFSIMSPIMFADGNEGQVALRMFAAADQGVVVTEYSGQLLKKIKLMKYIF